MHPDFWHERWQRGEIGWHRDDINVHLQEHWHRVGAEPGTQVLVPLCGKTRDLLWLAAQGHPVLGVEVSAIAVEAFFSDNTLSPAVSDQGAFRRYAVDELEILCGDFFDLTPAQVSRVGAIYDRASLIALPPSMRADYAAHLKALTGPGTRGLLITLEYPQNEMAGPPFSVPEPEVQRLLGTAFDPAPLRDLDVLAEHPRFQERGLTRLRERIYLLTRRGNGPSTPSAASI